MTTLSADVLAHGVQGVRFTKHAILRLTQMGLHPAEVVDVIASPQIERPGGPRQPHLRLASKGALTVVYDPTPTGRWPSGACVVTILPWTQDTYQRPKGD